MPDPADLNDVFVGERFWLARGRDMLLGAANSGELAAQQLMAVIGWFWTAYTAAALVGVALADRTVKAWEAVLLALPGVLLVVAYAVAAWAAMPIIVRFDPRVPFEIEEAHLAGVACSRRRLTASLVATGVAALSVAAAIVGTALARTNLADSLDAVVARSGPTSTIAVSGDAASQYVAITVVSLSHVRRNRPMPRLRTVVSVSGGRYSTAVRVTNAPTYRVFASWQEGRRDVTYSMSVSGSSTGATVG